MTLHIPVKFMLFVLYTCALLGGAFGISYAVFEWRDDGGGSDSGLTLESLEARIDKVDGRVDSVTNRVSGLSTASGSNDSTACHNAILARVGGLFEATLLGLQGVGSIPPSLAQVERESNADIGRYC